MADLIRGILPDVDATFSPLDPPRSALVTGGAGFIGSHVVERLLERGCESVLVLDDLSSGRIENLDGLDVRLDQVDVATPRGVRSIEAEKPEVVYHLAAQTDVQASVRDPFSDAVANVLGTLRVVEAAKRCGARVVFSSTGGAMYGDAVEPARETAPTDPRAPYAISKLAGEGYLLLHDQVVLRYANVYGPRQLAAAEGGVVAIFLDHLRRGERPVVYGDGLQTRDFVHVQDVAEATIDAFRLPSGVYNVGTGVATSILRLLEVLDASHELAPERPGEVRFSVLDSSKLRHWFGWWEPRSVPAGLAAMRETVA